MLVHVDDILMATAPDTTRFLHEAFYKRFSAKLFTEPPYNFLGVTIARTENGWIVNQSSYIDQILESEGMANCNISRTPMQAKLELTTPEHRNQLPEYRSILGKLGYLRMTRPDLAFVLSLLGKYSQGQDQEHLIALKRVMRYLRGTRDLTLRFEYKPGQRPTLMGYSDATWNSHKDSSHAHLGDIIFLNDVPIIWKSQKIKRLTSSSTASEIIAMEAASKAVETLREQLEEMGMNFDGPTVMYTDNKATKEVAKQEYKITKELSNVSLKVNLLRERVRDKIVRIEHIERKFNLADALCKVEGKPLFESTFTQIFGHSIYDTERPKRVSDSKEISTDYG
jgi:hypothetical protein